MTRITALLCPLLFISASPSTGAQAQPAVEPTFPQALALFQGGDYVRAGAVFGELLRRQDTPELHYYLGLCLVFQFRPEAAEPHLDQAVRSSKANANWWMAYGRCLQDQRLSARAREAYDAAVKLSKPGDPTLGTAFLARGLSALDSGDYKTALEDLNRCVQLNPRHSRAWFHLGIVHTDLGDRANAKAALVEASKLDPDNLEATYLLGLAEFGLGHWNEAAVAFESVLAKVPSHVGAVWNLAHACQKLKRKDEAVKHLTEFKKLTATQDRIESLETATKINPDHHETRRELVSLLLSVGRAQDALNELEILRIKNPSALVFLDMARAFKLLGRLDDAKRAEAAASDFVTKKNG